MSINELRRAIQNTPEPKNPSIKLNGTAIMQIIQLRLEEFGVDAAPILIWIGSEVYYRLAKATTDTEWPFKTDFDNEKALIFGYRFIVCDQWGMDAVTYHP